MCIYIYIYIYMYVCKVCQPALAELRELEAVEVQEGGLIQ